MVRKASSDKTEKSPHASQKRDAVLIGITFSLIVAIGSFFALLEAISIRDQNNQRLKTSLLASAYSQQGKAQTIVASCSQLIDGVKKGTFSLSKAQLASIYLQRAAAYLQLGTYVAADNDAAKATSYDAAQELAPLQIELRARYQLGQRQQLIPILQRLMVLKAKTTDPMADSAITQWQGVIDAIKANQDIQL